jgi:hypothetical protein
LTENKKNLQETSISMEKIDYICLTGRSHGNFFERGVKHMSKTSNSIIGTNLSKTHVPDKVYAYSLQVRHALYELLSCTNDDIVSIEVLDDVAIEKDDGSVEAIQLKSVLSNRNPISNRAADLWKTLYNWLLAVKAQELDPNNTIFKLFIATAKQGSIVNSFNNAETLEAALESWGKAKLEFYEENGNEKSIGDEYALYVRTFFNNDNKIFACRIIQKFHFIAIDNNHTAILYNQFCQKTIVPDDLMENVFVFMLGWIDKKTAELIETGKPMSISYKHFKNQLIAITRELNQKLSLNELAPKPTEDEILSEYNTVKRYIEQLEIVDCDYTDKIQAISDYLRASTNRTLWASRGDISEESLNNYQNELITKWNNKRNILRLSNKNLSVKEQGQLLYFQCKDGGINIGHLCVPGFFTPGCYHALSDDMTIGWHPEYKRLLKKACESDEQSK